MNLEKRIIALLVLIFLAAIAVNFKDSFSLSWRDWNAKTGPPVYTIVSDAFGVDAGLSVHDAGSKRIIGHVLSIQPVTAGIEIRIQPERGIRVGAGSSVTIRPGSVTAAPILQLALSNEASEPGRLPSSIALDVPAGILEPAPRWPSGMDTPTDIFFTALIQIPDSHHLRALDALRRGNPVEASVHAQRALGLYPANTSIRQLSAHANYLRGRPSAALEILSTIPEGVDTSRSGAMTHIMRGSAAFSAGLYSLAVRNLEIGLDLARRHQMPAEEWIAAFNLAAALRRMGRLEPALQLLEEGPKGDHDAKLLKADLLFRLNREDESLVILEELSKTSLIGAINYGIILQRTDRVDQSISILSWLAHEWPDQSVIQFQLGRSYEKSGALSQARAAYLVAADAESDTGLRQLYRSEAERLAE